MTQNFKEALLNKARIEFLIFRSKVNEQATSITQELAELNALSIAVNQRILEANEEIKSFNNRMMAENGTLMDVLAQLHPTSEGHEAMIRGNLAMLQDLAMHASANAAAVDILLRLAEESNAVASQDAVAINKHRKVRDVWKRHVRLHSLHYSTHPPGEKNRPCWSSTAPLLRIARRS